MAETTTKGQQEDGMPHATRRTIGYNTFNNGDDCRAYYRHILTGYRKHQDLNEVRKALAT